MLGRDKGVAHTDIVKCPSEKFTKSKKQKEIISNCKHYFDEQLRKKAPKLIICNGIAACTAIKEIIRPVQETQTSYRGDCNGSTVTVVLSGFIGRIDDYAKRRLGFEIEQYMKELGIG